VAGPLGDLADVAASGDHDRDEAVPEPVEGDAGDARSLDGGLKDVLTPRAEEGAAGRGGEDEAVAGGVDVVDQVLLDAAHHPACDGNGPLRARSLGFVVEGDVTPQLNRGTGDADARPQGVDVLATKAGCFAPAKARVGADEDQGTVTTGNFGDQSLDLGLGQVARRLGPFGRQRNRCGRVVHESLIGDRRFEGLAESEHGFARRRGRQAGVHHLDDPPADVAVGDVAQRGATEAGKDLAAHRDLEANHRGGPEIVPSGEPVVDPQTQEDVTAAWVAPGRGGELVLDLGLAPFSIGEAAERLAVVLALGVAVTNPVTHDVLQPPVGVEPLVPALLEVGH